MTESQIASSRKTLRRQNRSPFFPIEKKENEKKIVKKQQL